MDFEKSQSGVPWHNVVVHTAFWLVIDTIKTAAVCTLLLLAGFLNTVWATTGVAEKASAGTNAASAWTYTTVTSLVSQLYPYDPKSGSERENAQCFLETAQAVNAPVPSNALEFVSLIYTIRYTDWENAARALGFISDTTNEAVTDLLLWGFTNYHFVALTMPKEHSDYKPDGRDITQGKSGSSLRRLRRIGTPYTIDKLNKMLRQLCNEGRCIHEPGETIDPDLYATEAKDWLLNYPEDLVRWRMAGNWLGPSRPETPEPIRRHIKWLKTLPQKHPFWSSGDESWKGDALDTVERDLRDYEVQYQRWLEDGKHKNINAGSYKDEHWDRYKKEREAERAKERAAQAGSTNNVTTNKP